MVIRNENYQWLDPMKNFTCILMFIFFKASKKESQILSCSESAFADFVKQNSYRYKMLRRQANKWKLI